MPDTILSSYDINGEKLSFSNWISNLSPVETPFVSMTSKEKTDQLLFQWQTDSLIAADSDNAEIEGSAAEASQSLIPTVTKNNYTQILRKVVKVSDTASSVGSHGRGSELKYQMEKAGEEIKRDLEKVLLSEQVATFGDSYTIPRKTGAFRSLVAVSGEPDESSGAITHKSYIADLSEAMIFDMTYNLYIAGSRANTIMFHPRHAALFAGLQGANAGRVKLFPGDSEKYSKLVTEVTDPLGQTYKLLPSRFMPPNNIYFLHKDDWSQMVLREPEKKLLAKDGSSEKWMIEMEIGLRHRHPYASGCVDVLSTINVLQSISYGSTRATTLGFGANASAGDRTFIDTVSKIPSSSTDPFVMVADTPARTQLVLDQPNSAYTLTPLVAGTHSIIAYGKRKTFYVADVTINLTVPADMYVGMTTGIASAAVTPTAGSVAYVIRDKYWSVDKPNLATIDPVTGSLTALAAGTVNVIYTTKVNSNIGNDVTMATFSKSAAIVISAPTVSAPAGINDTGTAVGVAKRINMTFTPSSFAAEVANSSKFTVTAGSQNALQLEVQHLFNGVTDPTFVDLKFLKNGTPTFIYTVYKAGFLGQSVCGAVVPVTIANRP